MFRRQAAPPEAVVPTACAEGSEAETTYSMGPNQEGFVLVADGSASVSRRECPLAGRLQLFVARGSQYATWRQFPEAIRYELQDAAGHSAITPDLTLSISEEQQTYTAYASLPANQVVGRSFCCNPFDLLCLTGLIEGAGRYRLRAHYFGQVSNWVELDLRP